MLLDLTQELTTLRGDPLPFSGGEDKPTRTMMLGDALLQLTEADAGPERNQMGQPSGPGRLQAYRLGLDIVRAGDELELSSNDAEILLAVVQRSRGPAVIVGQVEALLDQAKADWQAAKKIVAPGSPIEPAE